MEAIDRRDFMKSMAGAAALAAMDTETASASDSGPVFLATWVHGKPANERAAEVFRSGGSLLDAVEKGINVPENDPNVTSVGYGGLPNQDGEVELDAAIMDGTRHRAGAVCSLRQIKNPISVARQVIERTRHTTLAGEGAFRFALKMGFQPQQLLTPESLKKWMDWKSNPQRRTYWLTSETHDTIGMLGTDGKGHIGLGVFDFRAGVENSRPGGRFSPGWLRCLCRRQRGRRLRHRRWRPDDQLLHQRFDCPLHGERHCWRHASMAASCCARACRIATTTRRASPGWRAPASRGSRRCAGAGRSAGAPRCCSGGPVPSAPGWLVRCLTEFADREINLTKIESRPRREGLGSYVFFVDLSGRAPGRARRGGDRGAARALRRGARARLLPHNRGARTHGMSKAPLHSRAKAWTPQSHQHQWGPCRPLSTRGTDLTLRRQRRWAAGCSS